jgi:outer membrane protein OmpA-like peptidoglycan-associated protein
MRTSRQSILPLALLASSALCAAQDGANPGSAVQPVTVHATAHFDFDRTTVLPADQQALLSEVAAMKDVTWRTVSAEGYADNVGSANYNKRLSARRAKAVRAFLIGKGLDPQMVRAAGQGTANPIADNATADGRARNRRTEVTFEGVRAVATNTH